MWVHFTDRFRYSPEPGWSQIYKPGTLNVTTPCAKAAIAAGKAIKVSAPPKGKKP